MSYKDKKLEIIEIIISSNLIFPSCQEWAFLKTHTFARIIA